jgi:hypothetical protein
MLAEDVAPEVRLHRNIRQAEIVPQVELERVSAVVVGCGAIGSWLARFLAHLGVPHFVLVDPDTVTTENLGLQGYEARDLDMPKAGAMAEAHVLRCTARGTVCTAAAPALQMATQCMLWLKGQRTCDGNLARDVEGNLLATTFEWIGTTEGVDSGGEGDDGLQDQDREVEAP